MPQYSPVLRSLKVLSAIVLYATILTNVAVIKSIIWDHSLCHNTRECCSCQKYYLGPYSMPQYSRVLPVESIICDHTLCHNTRECYQSKVLSATILYATILASVTLQKYYLRPYSMPQYLPIESIICDHTLCPSMPGCYRSKVLSATILHARRLVRILQNPMLVRPKMLHIVAHGCQAVGNGHQERN
jgi:hypothetical protein